MKLIKVGIALFLSGGIVYSQEDSVWFEKDFFNELEIISPEEEESDLVDYLEEMIDNPVNVNTADINDLIKIPGINNSDAMKILEYRKRTGRIFSLYELYSIPGIDAQRMKNFLPYLSTSDIHLMNDDESELEKNPFTTDFRSRLISGLQQKRGYLNNTYQGNSFKIYNRFKLKHENGYTFGMLSEKDPGEKDYMDHTAFYFQVKETGIIKSFIAGDYNIEFGKGLAIWSQYGISKNPSDITGNRNDHNIVPYLSTNEGHFLRGAALNLRYNYFDLTTFYSKRMKDARIDSIYNNILSLPSDGYHRTTNESARKGLIEEVVSGARINYSSDYISAGLLFYNSVNDYPFISSDKFPSGRSFNYLTFSYNFSLFKLNFSGEISSFRNTIAYLNSAYLSVTDNIQVFFGIINSPENYFSFLSVYPNGESGIFTGVSITSIPGDFKFYYNSVMKQSSSFFSVSGNELLAEYQISPYQNILCRLRYRNTNDHLTENGVINRQNFLSEFNYKLNRALKLKWRMDYSLYSEPKNIEKGYAFFQEIAYNILNRKIELTGRVTLYKTNSYNTRIYQYEKDLTGIFNMNPLFDEGIRWYLNLIVNIGKSLKLHCKYAETNKPDALTLGSGNNEIAGSRDNQLSLQLDLKI